MSDWNGIYTERDADEEMTMRRSRQVRGTRARHIARTLARRGEGPPHEYIQHGTFGAGHLPFMRKAKNSRTRLPKLARVVSRSCWPT